MKIYIRHITVRLMSAAMLMMMPLMVHGQGSLDDPRLNQFLVSVTGAGSLQPAAYYNLLHKSYQSDATESNRLILTGGIKAVLMGEEPNAESIDSALVKRAKVEALRVADRQVDLVWNVQGGKIRKRLDSYKNLINKITFYGGTLEDKDRYQMDYDKLTCQVKAVQDCYMDNSNRAREYSAIYEDVIKSELDLLDFIKRTIAYKKAKEDYEDAHATGSARERSSELVTLCHDRWKSSFILGNQ